MTKRKCIGGKSLRSSPSHFLFLLSFPFLSLTLDLPLQPCSCTGLWYRPGGKHRPEQGKVRAASRSRASSAACFSGLRTTGAGTGAGMPRFPMRSRIVFMPRCREAMLSHTVGPPWPAAWLPCSAMVLQALSGASFTHGSCPPFQPAVSLVHRRPCAVGDGEEESLLLLQR